MMVRSGAAAAMPAREVPAHERFVLAPIRHAHALVIPVINEGERIRGQLRAIARLEPPVDIVVADGGSTDGSLALEFLRAQRVRALLVKTGPGRLSAQLRMAYAWCLDQGYQGIVTIDGNGKDGLEAIPRFVETLQAGFDYVQGSRYIVGGKAINTPLDRKLAGRLIHAPIVSLAAGIRLTDTTNGFRAYSARYLSDSRVAPFRNLFDGYSLLFYLSIRAHRLGYRTCEIPVVRRYPPSGKTPSKINRVRGRIEMMGELLAAACGRLNPRSTATGRSGPPT